MSAADNKKSHYINDKEISFKFDGKKYLGYKGDTIASVSYTHLTLPTNREV